MIQTLKKVQVIISYLVLNLISSYEENRGRRERSRVCSFPSVVVFNVSRILEQVECLIITFMMCIEYFEHHVIKFFLFLSGKTEGRRESMNMEASVKLEKKVKNIGKITGVNGE